MNTGNSNSPPADIQANSSSKSVFALSLLSLVALMLSLSSCSDSSSGFFGSSFSVVESFPQSQSTNASPTTVITLRFSTAIDSSTVSASTILIQGSSSGVPQGTYVVSDNDRKVDFILNSNTSFSLGEVVTITVTSSVRAQNGGSADSFTYRFTVTPIDPNINPAPVPQVTSMSPSAWVTDASPSGTIRIDFDEAMDPDTIVDDAVSLFGSISGKILASASLSNSGLLLTITPDRSFIPQETITVTLADSLRSQEDQTFPGYSYSFQVQSSPNDPISTPHLRGPDIVIGETISKVLPADFNHDGLLDLAVSTSNGTQLRIYKGDGLGEFTAQPSIDLGQVILEFALADIDGNGWLDLVLSTVDRLALIQLESVDNDTILFSNEVVNVPQSSPVRGITVGEIDHQDLDKPDFILDTDAGIRIHLGGLSETADQELGVERLARTEIRILDLELDFPDDGITFTSDGWLDLAYGTLSGDALAINRLQPENGTYEVAHNLSLPSDAHEVLTGDIDRDGKPDLFVLTPLSQGGEFFQMIPTSQSSPDFLVPGVYPTLGISSLQLVDLNGDGWLDVLHTNSEMAKVRYLSGGQAMDSLNGPFEDLMTNVPLSRILPHDFTGDGKIDIVGVAQDRLFTFMTERPQTSGEATITVGDISGTQGATDFQVPVRVTSDQDLSDLSLLIGFDANLLFVRDLDFTGSAVESAQAEFTHFDLYPDDGLITTEIQLEASAPDEDKVLGAGENLLLFQLTFDIKALATPGTSQLTVLATDPLTSVETQIRDAHGNEVTPLSIDGQVDIQANPGNSTVNALSFVSDREAETGSTDQLIPIIINNEAQLDGFTVTVSHDPQVLDPKGVEITGSLMEGRNLLFEHIDTDPVAGWSTYNAILNPVVPDNVIPASTDQVLFNFVYDVFEEASVGETTFEFITDAQVESLNTVLLSNSLPVTLTYVTGSLEVVQPIDPPENTLSLSSLSGTQGDTDLVIEVRLSNESPADRVTAIFKYDPATLEILGFDLTGTVAESYSPMLNESFDDIYGEAILDLLFKSILGGETYPAQADQVLFKINVRIKTDAPAGEHDLLIVEQSHEGNQSSRLLSEGTLTPLTLTGSTLIVDALPPVENPNKLWLEHRFAQQGEIEVHSTVMGTYTGNMEAYTIIGRYPSEVMSNLRFDYTGSPIEAFGPELVLEAISPEDGTFTHTAFFDNTPIPGEERSIPPGEGVELVHFLYDIPADAVPGDYQITFENLMGDLQSPNSFVFDMGDGVNSQSVYPERTAGDLVIGVPQVVFVRGDVNLSGTVDHSDYQALVSYLNLGNPIPLCLDAADVNDDGIVDDADYLALLQFVFTGAPVPPAPLLGNPAPDPTEDGLDCQQGL